MDKDYIITIDGPGGSGKSTVGRLLARKQGLVYLDTGAMYRVVGLETKKRGINPDDEKALQDLCSQVDISFKPAGDGQRVFSGDNDVTDAIRAPEISMLASRVSAVRAVREALVALQRHIGKNGGIVVDGRDAGTVIFPRARFKFYLDAAVETRAQRRYKELIEKKMNVDYNQILSDVQKRDLDDSSRVLAPLRPAADAVIIDTTGMTIEDVLSRISSEIELKASLLP
ncbi:MAG: (d)CMP kinase [Pseudomonadota bacterium]